jgi:hypothetical protein
MSSVSYAQDSVLPSPGPDQKFAGDTTGIRQTSVVTYSDLLSGATSLLPRSESRKIAVVQPDIYVKNFGFFCRKELRFEKSTNIPIRLRLGSLEQCNKLEQKD